MLRCFKKIQSSGNLSVPIVLIGLAAQANRLNHAEISARDDNIVCPCIEVKWY